MRGVAVAIAVLLLAACRGGDAAPAPPPSPAQLTEAMQAVHDAAPNAFACDASDRFNSQQHADLLAAHARLGRILGSSDLSPAVRRALARAQPLPVLALCPEGPVRPHLARYVDTAARVGALVQRTRR